MEEIQVERLDTVDSLILFSINDSRYGNQLDNVSWRGQFNILQSIWDLRIGYEEYVSSPLFPIIVSISFYFICITPWMFVDLFGQNWTWIRHYKIQPEVQVTWPAMRTAIGLTLWNHLLYLLPISMAQCVWTPATPLPPEAPGLWELIWQNTAALMIFDLEYYTWHFIHHKVRFLYKHVHAVHHQYHSPNSWVSEYLHPYELICIGVFTTTSPWFFTSHLFTNVSFMLLSIVVSVDDHIGYDLPLLPHRWLPIWGGSIKHDMHHQRPYTNFQPFFNYFDKLFGTECPGQRAGGSKPEKLLRWEKNFREMKQERRLNANYNNAKEFRGNSVN